MSESHPPWWPPIRRTKIFSDHGRSWIIKHKRYMSDYHITGWVFEWISEMGGSGGSCSAHQDAQASTAWFHSDQLRKRSHRLVLFYDDLMSPSNGDTACFKIWGFSMVRHMSPCHLQHLDFLGCPKIKRVMCTRSLCGFVSRLFKTPTDWNVSKLIWLKSKL